MTRRKRSWDEEAQRSKKLKKTSKKKVKKKPEPPPQDDDAMTLGLDDLAADLGIDLDDDDEEEKPKKAKRTVKKKKKPAPVEDDEEEDDEDIDSLIEELEDDEEEEEKPKKRAKKIKKAPKREDDTKERDEISEALGIDIANECPVCRKMSGKCKCDEDDRTFYKRTRFEDGDKTAICPRDGAPLSSIFLPRPNAKPPFKLPQFVVVWGCAVCHADALSTAMQNARR